MSSVSSAYINAPEHKVRDSVDSARSSGEEARRSSFSLKNAAHKVYQAAKDHHKSVNSAFEAYYGINASRQHAEPQGSVRQKVLQAAKNHHKGVNSAFESYYGIDSYSHNTTAQGAVRS